MKKLVYGVVFALPADEEYDDIAHLWVRDADTAYWFSLSRGVESDLIEVSASDHHTQTATDLSASVSSTGISIRVGQVMALALDGYLEYVIEFHPESDDLGLIRET